MKADGTIVLQLRAEGNQGIIGDALVEYPPSHSHYAAVLKHLGGLLPGESKPVPPWSDEADIRDSRRDRVPSPTGWSPVYAMPLLRR